MRVASIDIGTNTILMLVSEVDPVGVLTVLSDEQRIARVGKGVDKTGAIAWEAFSLSEEYLTDYLGKAKALGVDVVRATGTSALRDAHNREDYLGHIHQRIGLDIEILDGSEEALLTYGGAISGFEKRKGRFAVLDIGGGSTEMTVGKGFHIGDHRSLDIGCVRLTEKFLHHSPPTSAEIDSIIAYVDGQIDAFPKFDPSNTTFVGVAGTVTTLAAVERGLKNYDGEAVAGFRLTSEMIDARLEQFRSMSRDELQQVLSIDPGRADIIFSGVLILSRLMKKRRLPAIVVSERGLRYGVALREWERSLERSSIS